MEQSRAVVVMAYDQDRYQIALFDLEADEVARSFVVEEDYRVHIGSSPLVASLLAYGRSWRQDSQRIVSEIVLLDIETGQEQVLVRKEGHPNTTSLVGPSISPDGQWVVYTATDGLRLVRPDGSDDHLLRALDMVRVGGYGEEAWDQWPPTASWSPDSRWLVYHRCMLPSPQRCYDSVQDYAIFKLNIETGEEVLLVEGGVNPYWRLAPGEAAQ